MGRERELGELSFFSILHIELKAGAKSLWLAFSDFIPASLSLSHS